MGFSNLRNSGSVPLTILNFGGKSPAYYKLLVTTLRPASPGSATWRIGGFGVFCHFGVFLPIWQFWQLFGDFLGSF